MITKSTFATPGVWRITSTVPAKKLAGPCEISALKLSSGNTAAFVALYDGVDSSCIIDSNLLWVLDCSTTTNDQSIFPNPIRVTKGVYAVCEDGSQDSPFLCISIIK